MGAGILPLSVFRSSIFILLGQERHNNLWSDFGGSSLKGETIYQTAIRLKYIRDENEVHLIKKTVVNQGFFEKFFRFFN